MNCERYGICLGQAARKDWNDFNCEACPECEIEPGKVVKSMDETFTERYERIERGTQNPGQSITITIEFGKHPSQIEALQKIRSMAKKKGWSIENQVLGMLFENLILKDSEFFKKLNRVNREKE